MDWKKTNKPTFNYQYVIILNETNFEFESFK